MSRDELGEREIKAYADGWRDAMATVATYGTTRERAGARPGPPRLRLVHRRGTEQAPDSDGTTTAPPPMPPPPMSPDPDPDPGADAAPDPAAPPSPRTDASRPATAGLVPKNPSSRVPTIPRLGSPRSLGRRIRRASDGEPSRSREPSPEEPSGRSRERDPDDPSPARPDG
ncbi:hypothetical protein ACFXP3_19945 [Streptomyces sp. NPDC059096]|uniref:hypothetical protein n=1 Tax=Streptomyces sp. NPDC059096 TaxID=3346727 RepID=UPI00368D7833